MTGPHGRPDWAIKGQNPPGPEHSTRPLPDPGGPWQERPAGAAVCLLGLGGEAGELRVALRLPQPLERLRAVLRGTRTPENLVRYAIDDTKGEIRDI